MSHPGANGVAEVWRVVHIAHQWPPGDALFAKIERLGFSYYDRVETGQLVTRLTNDVKQIRQFAGNGVIQLAASGFMLVGTTVLLLRLNWRLTLISLLIIPLSSPSSRRLCAASARCSARCSKRWAA